MATFKHIDIDGTSYDLPDVSKTQKGLCPKLPNETTTTKYLRQDGTWVVPPNTTYSVVSKTANGLCPQLPNESATSKYLRQDGTWVVPPNTTYGVVSKTANGLCPRLPNESTTTKYLRQDGTWVVPPNTTYGVVTTSANGLCPTLAGGTTKYLRADGTWQVPPDNNTTTGTTYTAPNIPNNITFCTQGSVANLRDAINSQSTPQLQATITALNTPTSAFTPSNFNYFLVFVSLRVTGANIKFTQFIPVNELNEDCTFRIGTTYNAGCDNVQLYWNATNKTFTLQNVYLEGLTGITLKITIYGFK